MTKERRTPESAGGKIDLGKEASDRDDAKTDPQAPEAEKGDDDEGEGEASPAEAKAAAAASVLAKASEELDRELERDAAAQMDKVVRGAIGETAGPKFRGAPPTSAMPNRPSFDWRVEDGKIVPNLIEGEEIVRRGERNGIPFVETSRTRFIFLCGIKTYVAKVGELWPLLVWQQHFPQAAAEPDPKI